MHARIKAFSHNEWSKFKGNQQWFSGFGNGNVIVCTIFQFVLCLYSVFNKKYNKTKNILLFAAHITLRSILHVRLKSANFTCELLKLKDITSYHYIYSG